jgi:hypothetical protein
MECTQEDIPVMLRARAICNNGLRRQATWRNPWKKGKAGMAGVKRGHGKADGG